jgi:signal transduction histidine kinase
MQVLYAVLLVACGVIAGWIGSRLLRRSNYRRDLVIAANPIAADPTWQIDARVLAEAIPVACFTVSTDGRIVQISSLGAREFPILTIGGEPEAWSPSLAEVVERAMLGTDSVTLETIFLDPARSLRVTALRYTKGVLVMLQDVSEDVDFEEARRTFSAAVSHELRTPLARILGLAETLALPDIEDERDELVIQIENEVDGMRKLIDEMLLLAALDRGRLAVADGIADASAIAAHVVADARQRRIGRGREITLTAHGEVDVPVAARLYEVVIQNLVDNALIHGGPEARVDVTVTTAQDLAYLTVSDTGVGIGAQHLPFVFQRFYRGDAARSGPGSGLGLALVKHIIEAHGGTVSAESDGTTGTTIRVVLPLAPFDSAAPRTQGSAWR